MNDKKEELAVKVTDNQIMIAETLDNFSEAQVAIVKNSVAKNTTNPELAYFLQVCQTVELNPLNKEIWCYKDKKGNLLVFAGRDGFLAKAQRSPFYNGIRSCEICEHDEYEIDIPNGVVHHKITKIGKERGNIIAAYAIVFRKDGESTIEFVEMSAYNKGFNAWSSHPADMIKKVAETHALKKAFGISGLQSEYDYNVNNGVAVPIQTKVYTLEEIESLYELKKESLSLEQQLEVEAIIEEKDEKSYRKVYDKLSKL